MVVGLSAIAAFAGSGQVGKALLITILGLIMAIVGEGALFNMLPFTMRIMDLQSGFNFTTLAMAMFALPEAMYLVLDPSRSKTEGESNEIKDLRITREEAKSIAPKEEQEPFSKGAIIGLAAPESANDSACTGSFAPLLTLGIPGSGITAILLWALIALNVSPLPQLMMDEPQIFWAVIISMYLGNLILLILLILNLPLIPYIAKVLAVPRNFLIPFILFFTLMGPISGRTTPLSFLSSWASASASQSCALPITRWRPC